MNQGEPMQLKDEARSDQQGNPEFEEQAREQEMTRSEANRAQPMQHAPVENAQPVDRPADEGRFEQSKPTVDENRGMRQSELAGYRDRFADLQTRFIDDPRGATDQACSLVKEAVDRMMDSMLEAGDTEQMRMAMQRYRNVLETVAEQSRR
jgi:hypothetical protein